LRPACCSTLTTPCRTLTWRPKTHTLQPFSQNSCSATVPKVVQIGLCWVEEADLELFCNSWSAGFFERTAVGQVARGSARPRHCDAAARHVPPLWVVNELPLRRREDTAVRRVHTRPLLRTGGAGGRPQERVRQVEVGFPRQTQARQACRPPRDGAGARQLA